MSDRITLYRVADVRRLLAAGPDPDARLFTGPRGGRITTAVLRDATHWDEVVTRLGHEHLRRHDLRHTGLTWLADAGIPLRVPRKIAGHGSPATTQRYLHPDKRSVEPAGAALSAHLSAGRSDVIDSRQSAPGPKVVPEDRPGRHLRLVKQLGAGHAKRPADLDLPSESAGLRTVSGRRDVNPRPLDPQSSQRPCFQGKLVLPGPALREERPGRSGARTPCGPQPVPRSFDGLCCEPRPWSDFSGYGNA